MAPGDRSRRRVGARAVVGGAGRVMVATGVMLLGFVAYQLWGTGLETARAQRELAQRFDEVLATIPVTTTPPTSTAPSDDPPVEEPPGVVQDLGQILIGDPIAYLEIPALGLNEVLIAGVGYQELRVGPGHFPESSMPGQYGRAAIAGHRTAWGEPFRRIDRLVPGDEIITTTRAGRFVYRVIQTDIVEPTEYGVVLTEDPARADLVLVTCHPAFTTDQRMVVTALLDESVSDPIGRTISYLPADFGATAAGFDDPPPAETDPVTETSDPAPTTTAADIGDDAADAAAPGDDGNDPNPPAPIDPVPIAESSGTVATTTADGLAGGWFTDSAAAIRLAIWGVALIAISTGAWQLSRRTGRNLIGATVGVVPFLIASFFFFQQLVRLVPSGL